jgi:hypothetical protein
MPPSAEKRVGLEGREAPPRCSPDPPPVEASADFLGYLLGIEIERLETARRIERERGFVFPETTVIIRDILKLRAMLLQGEMTEAATPEVEDTADSTGDLDDLLRQLRGEEHGR